MKNVNIFIFVIRLEKTIFIVHWVYFLGGVESLLECTGELEEYKYESSMNVTPSTSTVAAMCLQRIYENMYYDSAKEKFMGKIEEYVKEKLLSPEIESKVRVTATITSLLRGPLDVGNAIIGKDGIMQMILVMANTEEVVQQRVSVSNTSVKIFSYFSFSKI